MPSTMLPNRPWLAWFNGGFANNWLLDLVVGCVFAVTGAVLGYLIITEAGYIFFYQNFTPEVVYAACGYGFRHPGVVTGALEDFVLVRSTSFNCADLTGLETLGAPSLFFSLQRYLSYAVLVFWQSPILTLASLWPLAAIAYALYASGIYALLRQFFSLWLAVPGAVVVAGSPVALSMLVSFRDFSKAPFFIWCTVFLLLAMRSNRLAHAVAWGAAAGVVLGIGAGFRIDVLILIPVGFLALIAVWNLRLLMRRALAGVVMVACSLATAWPVLDVPETGGTGSIISQGLSEPFREFLNIEPALYDQANMYSDELALSSISAAERPHVVNWDDNEAPALYGVSRAMTLSSAHLLKWIHLFAADFATQGLKSASWIAGFPTLVASPRTDLDPGGPMRNGPWPSHVLAPVYDALGHSWLIPVAIFGLFCFAWREAALRPGQALGVAILFASFLAFPVAQFSIRHIFHLEFIWVIALLGLVASVFDYRKLTRVTRWFSILTVACFLIGATIYGGLLLYQKSALRSSFEALLTMPREPAAVVHRSGHLPGGAGVFDISVPLKHRAIIQSAPDSMTPAIKTMGIQWDVRAAADRLLLSLHNCEQGKYEVEIDYKTDENTWQPFSQTVDIVVAGGDKPSSLLIPAFYRPTQYLKTITVSPLGQRCMPVLERLLGDSPLPPHLVVRLPPDWQDGPLTRGFGGFSQSMAQ